jgi:hypothetical protein
VGARAGTRLVGSVDTQLDDARRRVNYKPLHNGTVTAVAEPGTAPRSSSSQSAHCWGYIQGLCPHPGDTCKFIHPADILPCTSTLGSPSPLRRLTRLPNRYKVHAVPNLAALWLPDSSMPAQAPASGQAPDAWTPPSLMRPRPSPRSHKRIVRATQASNTARLRSPSPRTRPRYMVLHRWSPRSSFRTTQHMRARCSTTTLCRLQRRRSARPPRVAVRLSRPSSDDTFRRGWAFRERSGGGRASGTRAPC